MMMMPMIDIDEIARKLKPEKNSANYADDGQ